MLPTLFEAQAAVSLRDCLHKGLRHFEMVSYLREARRALNALVALDAAL